MSFDGIKAQLVKRLGAQKLTESSQAFDFEGASEREFGNTFIIIPSSGETSEQLVTSIDDLQTWDILVAFSKSEHSDITQRDALSRKIAGIIADLDNPTNWQGVTNGAKVQKYQSWELTDVGNYYLLTIKLDIIDNIAY